MVNKSLSSTGILLDNFGGKPLITRKNILRMASPAGVPRAYNFNDFGCPASAKVSFDLQRQFPKLSSLPKAPGPDAAFKSAVRGCQASSRARKHRPVHFMRSALAQLVKEAAMRRCKPKTLLEGGVGPP